MHGHCHMLTLLRPRFSVPPVDLFIKHFRKTNFNFWFHLNTVPPFLTIHLCPTSCPRDPCRLYCNPDRNKRKKHLRHENNSLALDKYYRNAHTVGLLDTVCQFWDLVDISPPTVAHTHTSLILHPHALRWRTRKPSLVTRPSFRIMLCSVIKIMLENIKLNVPPLK